MADGNERDEWDEHDEDRGEEEHNDDNQPDPDGEEIPEEQFMECLGATHDLFNVLDEWDRGAYSRIAHTASRDAVMEFEVISGVEGLTEVLLPFQDIAWITHDMRHVQRCVTGSGVGILVLVDFTGRVTSLNPEGDPFVLSAGGQVNGDYGATFYHLNRPVTVNDLPDHGTMFASPPNLEKLRTQDGEPATTRAEVVFYWAMLLACPAGERRRLEQLLTNSGSCFFYISGRVTTQSTAPGTRPSATIPIPVVDQIVDGTVSEIYSICISPAVPQSIKHRSMWLILYPHVYDPCLSSFTLIDYATAQGLWPLGQPTDPTAEAWMVVSTLYAVGYTFTIEKNIARQLTTRAKAAAESIGSVAPSETQFKDALSDHQYIAGKHDSRNNKVLGWVVAVTENGVCDPDVRNPDLKSSWVLKEEYGWTDWTLGLYEQLRMTSMEMHASSIRFGIAALPVYKYIEPFVSDQMKADQRSLASIKARLEDRPYTGLVEGLPTWARISNQRSGIVFGLRYYEKGLDPTEKKNFADYKTDEIEKPLSIPEKAKIELAVAQAPLPTVTEWASLMKRLSLDKAHDLRGRIPADVWADVYKVLVALEDPGPYVRDLVETENEALRQDLLTDLIKLVKDERDITTSWYDELLKTEVDEDRRRGIVAKRAMEMVRADQFIASLGIKRNLGAAHKAHPAKMRMQAEIDRLNGLFSKYVKESQARRSREAGEED